MKKRECEKGFTLMEMLITVAIIVILMALALPTLTSQIDKVKGIVDESNLRIANTVVNAQQVRNREAFATKLYFDKENEVFVSTKPSPGYGLTLEHSGKVISAVWDDDSQAVILNWE